MTTTPEPPAGLDLPAYLDRIGLDTVQGPGLDSLRRIVAAHAQTIAFENLNPFTGREVPLDQEALTAKLVHGGRGGYCFEQNLLLKGALDALGFRTTGLGARVVWGRPEGAAPGARTHMLLRVELPQGPHLVDVGFGGVTLTGVLALEPETEQPTPHEPFRLWPDGRNGYVLQAKVRDTWRPVYTFDLGEQLLADYQVSNYYLSHHPASPFVSALMAARPAPDRRYALNGAAFAVHHLDGPTERRTLQGPSEVCQVLEEHFLLDLTGLPGLDAALARLF
ncbi:arylamine N-acetyltransferase family protein [Streptomyces pinistramenti]|uniref:arylamine N-acetyltransferase family protein n=1 Tax=Streptomyces pinistramenti TaxID=2884812 RepID=UPI001D08D1BF|nr:arylamine N-acetyltransferase [Streptomyces pinistramenti]MCB5906316.1 arylamine N-acetyltransferase [Streptomyces pinistramenti]